MELFEEFVGSNSDASKNVGPDVESEPSNETGTQAPHEYNSNEDDDARARVPITPLITPVSGLEYPPNPFSARGGQKTVAPKPAGNKRKKASSSMTLGDEAKIPKKFKEGPSYKVLLPNHSFLNKGMIENEDETLAMHYCQGICSTEDWNRLKYMTNDAFNAEHALLKSKVLPYEAQAFARARIGYENPTHVMEVQKAKAEANKLQEQLEEAQNAIHRAEFELKHTKDLQANDITRLKDRNGRKLVAAYDKGVDDGHAGFLRSDEGLMMVGRIQEVTREATLHSRPFVRASAKAAKWYIKRLKATFNQLKKEGKSLEGFDMDATIAAAGDYPEFLQTDEQAALEAIDAVGLLNYFEACDATAAKKRIRKRGTPAKEIQSEGEGPSPATPEVILKEPIVPPTDMVTPMTAS